MFLELERSVEQQFLHLWVSSIWAALSALDIAPGKEGFSPLSSENVHLPPFRVL